MLQLHDRCDNGENVYRHAVVHQGVGIHNGDKLVKEVWLGFKQFRGKIPHH